MSQMDDFKARTCKFNSNRKSADLVNPYCTWRPGYIIPPHVMWVCEICTPDTCYHCECYKSVHK